MPATKAADPDPFSLSPTTPVVTTPVATTPVPTTPVPATTASPPPATADPLGGFSYLEAAKTRPLPSQAPQTPRTDVPTAPAPAATVVREVQQPTTPALPPAAPPTQTAPARRPENHDLAAISASLSNRFVPPAAPKRAETPAPPPPAPLRPAAKASQPKPPQVNPRPAPARSAPAPDPRPPARQAAPGDQPPGSWSLGDLLARASEAEEKDSGKAPTEAVLTPQSAPGAPPPRTNGSAAGDATNALRLNDLANAIDHQTAATLWHRFRQGDRGVFNKQLYSNQGQAAFDEIADRYRQNSEFRTTVDRYIGDFERLLHEAESKDPRGSLLQNYLTSETGRGLSHAGPCQRPPRLEPVQGPSNSDSVCNSAAFSMGLVQKSVAPACRHFCRSSCMALAVTATIGMSLSCLPLRILSIAS